LRDENLSQRQTFRQLRPLTNRVSARDAAYHDILWPRVTMATLRQRRLTHLCRTGLASPPRETPIAGQGFAAALLIVERAVDIRWLQGERRGYL
jgi:hypothetical protein